MTESTNVPTVSATSLLGSSSGIGQRPAGSASGNRLKNIPLKSLTAGWADANPTTISAPQTTVIRGILPSCVKDDFREEVTDDQRADQRFGAGSFRVSGRVRRLLHQP